MKSIPVTPLTLDVARRIIWFESPEEALVDPIRFMAIRLLGEILVSRCK